jgi:hypothetical protein
MYKELYEELLRQKAELEKEIELHKQDKGYLLREIFELREIDKITTKFKKENSENYK